MEPLNDYSVPTIVFEHACKHEFEETIRHILQTEDFVSQIIPDITSLDKSQVKPVFMFIFLLKKLYSTNILTKLNSVPEKLNLILPIFINLLETTYLQCNFISLKKYFTFISELKLLDLLSLIVRNLDSSQILQKLNQYFPRWTLAYKSSIEKGFASDNSKILDKVEESHGQCRRLILKLAVDLNYRSKYMSEQYNSDIERISKETEEYIKESVKALLSCSGTSLLETLVSNEEDVSQMKDLGSQLLLEYVQPNATDSGLVNFLKEIQPSLNMEQTSGLASCLLPFDSMSDDEDSDESDSEYELSQTSSQS